MKLWLTGDSACDRWGDTVLKCAADSVSLLCICGRRSAGRHTCQSSSSQEERRRTRWLCRRSHVGLASVSLAKVKTKEQKKKPNTHRLLPLVSFWPHVFETLHINNITITNTTWHGLCICVCLKLGGVVTHACNSGWKLSPMRIALLNFNFTCWLLVQVNIYSYMSISKVSTGISQQEGSWVQFPVEPAPFCEFACAKTCK